MSESNQLQASGESSQETLVQRAAQTVTLGIYGDQNALQRKLSQLEEELRLAKQKEELLRAEKDALMQKHMNELSKRDEEHGKRVQGLKQKIKELKQVVLNRDAEINELKRRNADFEKRVAELEQNMRKMQNQEQRARFRLLLGTLSYTYMESAIEYVFQPNSERETYRLRRRYPTIDDLEEAALNQEHTKTRWESFCATYWAGRLCPHDEAEEPPSPARMKEIAQTIYNNRYSRNTRQTIEVSNRPSGPTKKGAAKGQLVGVIATVKLYFHSVPLNGHHE
ncbi:hypothetical protein QOT17_001533 [Balamuthia mandrillaris]